MTSTLQRLLARYGEHIDDEIRSCLSDVPPSDPFYGMMRYQLGYVDAEMKPAAFSGGKRFRPMLSLLGCEACGSDWKQALHVAAAIELLHNFSLIHDDIEDGDLMRRHRPTVWAQWGQAQAINAGDGMFALAGKVILESLPSKPVLLDIARAYQSVCLTLTRGQFLDMSYEQRESVTPEEYLDMIQQKTAALIGFSLWTGARVAGASDSRCRSLERFGQALGKAFQIRDDMQGIWSPSTHTGKEEAKDLHNRKKTLPVLIARARATGSPGQIIDAYFRREHDDTEAVLRIMTDLDAQSGCRRYIADYLVEAQEALDAACLPTVYSDEFRSLALELAGT